MIEYEAVVTVEMHDRHNMVRLHPVTLHVKFAAEGDPRELLSRIALERALEAAQAAERFMT